MEYFVQFNISGPSENKIFIFIGNRYQIQDCRCNSYFKKKTLIAQSHAIFLTEYKGPNFVVFWFSMLTYKCRNPPSKHHMNSISRNCEGNWENRAYPECYNGNHSPCPCFFETAGIILEIFS